MNLLADKRMKNMREMARRNKEKKFAEIRQKLLRDEEQSILTGQSQLFKWLVELITCSLQPNNLITKVRNEHLLTNLQQLKLDSLTINELQALLILCGNITHDDLNYVEKQIIVDICLRIYNCQHFSHQLEYPIVDKCPLLMSVSTNLCQLSKTAEFIGENQALQIEQLVFSHITTMLSFLCLVNESWKQMLTSSEESLRERQCKQIFSCLDYFCASHKENHKELDGRMRRNGSSFLQFKKILCSIATKARQNSLLTMIYQGLLSLVELLSEEIKTSEFPLFFEDQQLIQLLLWQASESRCQVWSKMAINSCINIIVDYTQSQNSIQAFLIVLNKKLESSQFRRFFHNLLDGNVALRQKLNFLKLIFLHEQLSPLFKNYLEEYWKNIVDSCLNVIKKEWTDLKTIQLALTVLIILSQQKQLETFWVYLQSIGGYIPLEHLVYEMKIDLKHSNQQTETIYQNITEYAQQLLNQFQKKCTSEYY